jgi:hypothetical protein
LYGAIFDFFVKWMVILVIGTVIKLMDDYLYQDLDKIEGKYTLAMFLEKATLPYTLLCTVMCMVLEPVLTGSLFLASYVVGMGHELQRQLPLGWTALQETLLFGTFGIIGFGLVEMVSSLVIVLFIQLADDFVDYHSDAMTSRRNFVLQIGLWESVILGVIVFVTAFVLDVEKAILVSISTPLILVVLGDRKRLMQHDQ